MIEEQAEVVRADDARLWVRVDRQSSCASCVAKSGCGQKRLLEWFPSRSLEIEIKNTQRLPVQPGQIVALALEEGALVRASMLLYGAPITGLILVTLLFAFFQTSELFHILGGTLGLISGFVFSRLVAVRALALGSFEPKLVKIVT